MDLESQHNSFLKQIKNINQRKKNRFKSKKDSKFNPKFYLSKIKEPFFENH